MIEAMKAGGLVLQGNSPSTLSKDSNLKYITIISV
jgi:hypothetical protein